MKKIITLLSIVFSLTVNAQTLCFSAPTNFTLSASPCWIINNDFNGDGKKDLALAIGGTVAVSLNSGTGSFGSATNFVVGTGDNSVCSADFNGDGKADLASANQSSFDISVLLGTGTGSFGTATTFTLGGTFGNPYSIITSDFNGDGKADLVTANGSYNKVAVLLGTGTGSFGSATYFAANSQPSAVANADFNGDGKQDLVVANNNVGTISVLLGTGTGSFGAPTSFTVGTGPLSITIADFNGDTKKDVAISNVGTNNVSVLLGTGTGSFGVASNFATGTSPASIVSGDYDGDGKIDLATSNFGFSGGTTVSVLLGTGTGSFGVATAFPVGSGPKAITSGDFNGDGKLDLATGNNSSNDASVISNCTIMDIANFNNAQEIKIYPNPTAGSLNIESTNSEKQTVQIFNINGEIVLNQIVNETTTIDVSKLNAGIYNISITNSSGVANKRIVIER